VVRVHDVLFGKNRFDMGKRFRWLPVLLTMPDPALRLRKSAREAVFTNCAESFELLEVFLSGRKRFMDNPLAIPSVLQRGGSGNDPFKLITLENRSRRILGIGAVFCETAAGAKAVRLFVFFNDTLKIPPPCRGNGDPFHIPLLPWVVFSSA
jgi:hypothetical protein